MDKVNFYSFINGIGKKSFLGELAITHTSSENKGFMIYGQDEADYTIHYYKEYIFINITDISLDVSLIDFVEMLKKHEVSSDIINAVVKQYEEWNI